MKEVVTNPPPRDPVELARWFMEGIQAEIREMEKNGGTQNYELFSGQYVGEAEKNHVLFRFLIADGTRIPEEASGLLKTRQGEYRASVARQEGNAIQLLLETENRIPPGISNGQLQVDDTALMKKLLATLEKMSRGELKAGKYASLVFHPPEDEVGLKPLPDVPCLKGLASDCDLRMVIEQSRGSPVTFVWGPPGTGKTYAIARLVAALMADNERVLVTSHTNAAVDQALSASVSRDEADPGSLYGSTAVDEGRVIRIGVGRDRAPDPRVPDEVRLEWVIEHRATALEEQILQVESEVRNLRENFEKLTRVRRLWDAFAEAEKERNSTAQRLHAIESEFEQESARSEGLTREHGFGRAGLEAANRAWFRRRTKVAQATSALERAERKLRECQERLRNLATETDAARELLRQRQARLTETKTACEGLPEREVVDAEMSGTLATIKAKEATADELQKQIDSLQAGVINGAQVIFCTLTKNYVGKELEGQEFDAVIIDEVSMALPPLLYVSGAKARKRVIMVGDFYQLPPIVRSDDEISNERLKRDVFELVGIDGSGESSDHRVLTRLSVQRRMVPAIADVARHLRYGSTLVDHESVRSRLPPTWLSFLPEEPLIIIDTADLHCWSGKQPGSLSRFNFYTATIAVELAAMAASSLPKPSTETRPVGIVTPFAAQRRMVMRLLGELELLDWVQGGTVHTFQGSQADLIIFDSVLDEPYWSSRLSTPGQRQEVLKELNVAVTRAKNKFVFIASSEWMNEHTKPASGLGHLWAYLKDNAVLLQANEVVGPDFAQRLTEAATDLGGWKIPAGDTGPMHEILDEATFFERFARDVTQCSKSLFGLVPYFGEYRWPRVQPLFSGALNRGVEVTLVTPPFGEAENRYFVEKAVGNLRELGAVVIEASGLHGKDIIIDERIHYTGSLNWASHRGRAEIMHRTESAALARLVLQFLQARFIRAAAVHEDRAPRSCPECGGRTWIVNQREQHWQWDSQAMKVGCAEYKRTGCKYLRNVDERPPLKTVPVCSVDKRTKYRRVRRGKGEIWQCPKHPRECPVEKVIPGDPE